MPERPLVTVMPGCVPHRRQPNGTDVREFAESWRLIHRGLVDASICAGQSTFADAVNKPHGVARLDMVLPDGLSCRVRLGGAAGWSVARNGVS